MVRMGKHPFKRFIAATTWLTVAILALGGNLAYAALSCTDNASNSGTQSGFTVVVDNTAPYATDIQATNMAGGVLGKAEQGDTATFTFNEPMDPQSIYSGWTGGSTTVTPRFVNGSGSSNDSFSVYDSANVTQLGLFSVFMGAKDFVSAN